MSVLNEICEAKAAHVKERKTAMPLAALEEQIKTQAPPRGFINRINAIAQNAIALITEVKKASPSKGIIREDFDPAAIARTYENGGAACISVLTDMPYFQGNDEHFKTVRENVDLPLIRKDFMIDPYQIYESRSLGADCILLIMAALDDSQARDLYALSRELGMDTLVEIHNESELERALKLTPAMIGVNNRNLKTLKVDVQTSFDLLEKIPENITKIAESGLSDHQTVSKLRNAGYSGFLIGESLMREPNIATALEKILGKQLTRNRN
jgi:indole-3-glycerol phosphate synthase